MDWIWARILQVGLGQTGCPALNVGYMGRKLGSNDLHWVRVEVTQPILKMDRIPVGLQPVNTTFEPNPTHLSPLTGANHRRRRYLRVKIEN